MRDADFQSAPDRPRHMSASRVRRVVGKLFGEVFRPALRAGIQYLVRGPKGQRLICFFCLSCVGDALERPGGAFGAAAFCSDNRAALVVSAGSVFSIMWCFVCVAVAVQNPPVGFPVRP